MWKTGRRLFLASLMLVALPSSAADVMRPASVADVSAALSGTDIDVSWSAVTLDLTGQPETVDLYRIYRGTTPDGFPTGFTAVGTSTSTTFVDTGAGSAGIDYYYMVAAVDLDGNEGQPRPSKISVAPTLSSGWTPSTVEVNWTDAAPLPEVVGYRVYYGTEPGIYTNVRDVGPATSSSFSPVDIPTLTQHFFVVTAVDGDGLESVFSNQVEEATGGTVRFTAHDEARLCFGGCPPQAGEVQRDSGRQSMVPVRFPEGDYVKALMFFTVDSRLCIREDPHYCAGPPWNPCGDPWDRTASVFLVEDDCIAQGGGCYGRDGNLELVRTVTPFGTDADPPEGTGNVGPRQWNYDVTPYLPMLTGTKHVGAFIGVWVSPGWYVDVEFIFFKNPATASPEPPADGFQLVSFRDGGNTATPTSVTIPATATQVVGRLFTTGHGANPPGNCDEFCQKTVEIRVDGSPVWSTIPWRTDCSPAGNHCSNWNSCGTSSCTFNRSGWCPGYIACHHNAPCDNDIDLTPWLTPGGTYDVQIMVPDINGSWANSLSIYWYE